ncbi:hypothetical protein ACRRTK_017854 [Alexandromys fortis]
MGWSCIILFLVSVTTAVHTQAQLQQSGPELEKPGASVRCPVKGQSSSKCEEETKTEYHNHTLLFTVPEHTGSQHFLEVDHPLPGLSSNRYRDVHTLEQHMISVLSTVTEHTGPYHGVELDHSLLHVTNYRSPFSGLSAEVCVRIEGLWSFSNGGLQGFLTHSFPISKKSINDQLARESPNPVPWIEQDSTMLRHQSSDCKTLIQGVVCCMLQSHLEVLKPLILQT